MSGFEIAGIVLGALPLLIEGLEQYRRGLETLSSMRHYKLTIENLIVTFESARARYIFACETLLSPLMLTSGQYVDLIAGQNVGQTWRAANLQAALEDRLGTAYGPYLGLVNRVHRALLKFASKMEIGLQGRVQSRLPVPSTPVTGMSPIPSLHPPPPSRIWHRIKVGLENGSLERLLEGMEQDIFRLERLLETSANLPAIRRDRNRRGSRRSWHLVRESAESLFRAIADGLRCSNAATHGALLKIDAIDIPSQNDRVLAFNVLLSKDSTVLSQDLAQMAWHNLFIESICEPSLTPRAGSTSSATTSGQHERVSFLANAISTIGSNPPQSSVSFTGPKIADLCSILVASPQRNCFGHFEEHGWTHTVRPFSRIPPPGQLSRVAKIRDLLRPATTSTQRFGLISPRQRYTIAVALVLAVLNLSETPWLSSYNSLQNIHVVAPNATTLDSVPYVLKSFNHTAPQSMISTNIAPLGIQNELLFQLGVLLLEIAYAKPISELRQAPDLDPSGNETPLTDYLVASRLANEIVGQESTAYINAIKRCLFCKFPCMSTDFADLQLQEEFHDGVVAPLLELYKVFIR